MWLPTDVDSMYAVYADEEGSRWVDDGTPITRAECDEWLRITAENYRSRGYGMFALEDRGSGNVIGFSGLVHPGGQETAEIKYAFLRSHWGEGLASEVVPALLAWGAKNQGLTTIIATVAPENIASQRVLLKSGMTLTDVIQTDTNTTQLYTWEAS